MGIIVSEMFNNALNSWGMGGPQFEIEITAIGVVIVGIALVFKAISHAKRAVQKA